MNKHDYFILFLKLIVKMIFNFVNILLQYWIDKSRWITVFFPLAFKNWVLFEHRQSLTRKCDLVTIIVVQTDTGPQVFKYHGFPLMLPYFYVLVVNQTALWVKP